MTPQIASATEALICARRLLCEPSPPNLDRCCGALRAARDAVNQIAEHARLVRRIDRGFAGAVAELRNELDAVTALLDRAAAYHANLLGAMTAAQSVAPEVYAPRASRLITEA